MAIFMTSLWSELRRRNVVRVAVLYGVVGWLILQVSDIAMPALGIPEWGLTLVLFILAVGFPIAVIFAWAFELTPEGLKRSRDVDPTESVTPVTGQKINTLIIGVLSLALLIVVIDSYVLKEPDTGDGAAGGAALTSIAVLPFVDMSPEQDQEYFTDGISEELLNLLAKIEDFKVAGRTSSFAFKGRNVDLREVGETLGVATILEGSVRKHRDRIRVTAQLVKVNDGYHLWSETYDRRLDDVFEIQDEIATEVVTALKQTLLGEADRAVIAASARPTGNTEAYSAYLRGKHFLTSRTNEDIYRALREFRHATELDPDFALAWTGVANAYSLLASYDFRTADEIVPLARQAVDTALTLDPGLGEAWAAKGLLLFQQDDTTAAERVATLEKAIELNPSDATAIMWLSTEYIEGMGELERGMELLQRAYAIDPLHKTLLFNLVVNHAAIGQSAEADRYLDELAAVDPDWDGLFRARAVAAFLRGRKDEQLRQSLRVLERNPEAVGTLNTLGDRYMDFGDYARAREMSVRVREINPAEGDAIAREAELLRREGETDAARRLLERMLQRRPDDRSLVLQTAFQAGLGGDEAEARRLLESVMHVAEDGTEPSLDLQLAFAAPQLIRLYRKADETERVQSLYQASVGAASEFFAGRRNNWLSANLLARLAAAAGDRDEALRQLQICVDGGGSSFYGDDIDPVWRDYADDAEIQALRAQLRDALETQRQALAAEGLIDT
jgi:TolB-like protein/Tfp pilus assembly protein PilF